MLLKVSSTVPLYKHGQTHLHHDASTGNVKDVRVKTPSPVNGP